MSPDKRHTEKRPPSPALTPSETDFNRWMEQLDIDSLNLDRLKLQSEGLADEAESDED